MLLGAVKQLRFVVLVLLHSVRGSLSAESLYGTLCPYTNFCQSNASMILDIDQKIPCCRPCSCENDCWKKGNCCPDMDHMPTRSRIEVCESAIVRKHEGDTSLVSGVGEIKRYYIVKTCPDTERNQTIVKACTGGESHNSYDNFVWVTGLVDGKIYKNKFCSECNGVFNYTFWNLLTNCTTIVLGKYSLNTSYMVPDMCRLVAVPPDKLDMSQYLCTAPTVSECNTTGNWKAYDVRTEIACRDHEQHFLQYVTDVFRNVFCFLCNSAAPKVRMDICPPIDSSSGSHFRSFSVLLNYRLRQELSQESALGHKCDLDEIHDSFQVSFAAITE